MCRILPYGFLLVGLMAWPTTTVHAAAMNEWCPVTPEERAKPQYHAEYEGARIYFCCARCRGRFERNPDAYSANLKEHVPALSAAPAAHDAGHEEPVLTHDHRDHAHDDLPPLLAWLGKHHPFAVHFPITFLLVAAGVELARIKRDRAGLADIVYFCVWVGSVSAVIAAILGWFFGGFRVTDGDWIMTAHRWLGTGAALWAVAILAACKASRASGRTFVRRLYQVLLFAGAMLIGATGFLGGSLIYGIDHLMWK